MKKGGNKKIIFIAIGITIICGSIYKLGTTIFGVNSYVISVDPQLSIAMQQSIKDSVYESYFGSLVCIAQSIKEICPAAGHITIERRSDNTLYISCVSEIPYLKLGDQMVLLKNGLVVESRCFAQKSIQDLPIISFKNDAQPVCFSHELKQWLLNLDATLIQNYAISWADDYEIYLMDKNDARNTIVCSVSNQIDENMREKCQRIIEEKNINAQGTARYVFLYC